MRRPPLSLVRYISTHRGERFPCLRKPRFFETRACSHNRFGLYYRVWVIDCPLRQGYKVSVVMAPCER
jgi:hypothetical protein